MANTEINLTREQHRQCAAALFNVVWTLLEKPDRSVADDDLMLHSCHAMWLHWSKAGAPVNYARAEWQLARVYSVLGRADRALHHARCCLEICREHGLSAFDHAFAYEALARASARAGEDGDARRWLDEAARAGRAIADDGDRQILTADLATVLQTAPRTSDTM